MYTSFYAMSTNPFVKDVDTKFSYESNDYRQIMDRLNYLKDIKGIGLITGNSGLGKTYTIRCFLDKLNKDLYKIIYLSVNKISLFDFYKSVAECLGLEVSNYKADVYNKIQNEIKRLVNEERITPVIIIDNAHNLSRETLLDLNVLYDFEMDSKDYVVLVLAGNPEIKSELSKTIHNSLMQRIIVNYSIEGLSREETKEYIQTRLSIANVENEIFTADAINALYSGSKASPRVINSLALNSLMLGSQKRSTKIDAEIIRLAKEELDINER